MKNEVKGILVLWIAGGLAACTAAPAPSGGDLGGDGKADGTQSGVSDDTLNGLWDGTLGTADVDDAVIRSWPAVGIELTVGGWIYSLTRTNDTLEGDGVELTIQPNNPGQRDDQITGTIDGETITLARDVGVKDPLTAELPGDRPWRMFLYDTLAPLAQQDRESYVVLDASRIKDFMASTVLYEAGYFQYKYMKGATRAEQDAEFSAMIDEIDGLETTPHAAIYDPTFSGAIKAHLRATWLTGLALTNFNLYFTTAAGRSVLLPLTNDAFAYFITDRPARAEKLGLVVMDTPAHDPLASTFGRQLLDLGAMPAADIVNYGKSMIELLAKSDQHTVGLLSGVGKSALVDYYAVMAIEDYRGTEFGYPDLGWGYNLTNAQLYGLLVKSLARPSQVDSAGDPIVGQVIVGTELRPGDPSYVDVLNGGSDMQEYPDMATLKTLTTQWLRSAHPSVVTAVETAFAHVIPTYAADSRAQVDIFHYITAQFYDDRVANLTAVDANKAIAAVTTLVTTLVSDSAALETYLLSHGITKSNTRAKKATGY